MCYPQLTSDTRLLRTLQTGPPGPPGPKGPEGPKAAVLGPAGTLGPEQKRKEPGFEKDRFHSSLICFFSYQGYHVPLRFPELGPPGPKGPAGPNGAFGPEGALSRLKGRSSPPEGLTSGARKGPKGPTSLASTAISRARRARFVARRCSHDAPHLCPHRRCDV